MPEDATEEIEEAAQKTAQKITTPDVCKTPAPPAEEVPAPYPHTSATSHTTSASKKVKIEGKEVMTKGSAYEKSSGNEPGKSKSEYINKIMNTAKKKKFFNIPILIWGFAAIVLLVLIWILTLNRLQPEEHLEQVIQFLFSK